jgi:ribonuclease HI
MYNFTDQPSYNGNPEYIFTDGATKGESGFIGIYFSFTDKKISEILPDKSSNQKSEFSSIKRAIQVIIDRDDTNDYIIVSDSMYALNCITKWYKKWEINNYKTGEDLDVKNAELIKEIVKLRSSVKNKLEFIHVKSHQKLDELKYGTFEHFLAHGNNQADLLAKALKKTIKLKTWKKIT